MAKLALDRSSGFIQFFQGIFMTAFAFVVIRLGILGRHDTESYYRVWLLLVAVRTALDRLTGQVRVMTTVAFNGAYGRVQAMIEGDDPQLTIEGDHRFVIGYRIAGVTQYGQQQ